MGNICSDCDETKKSSTMEPMNNGSDNGVVAIKKSELLQSVVGDSNGVQAPSRTQEAPAPPLPSNFDHLLDFSKSYSLSFDPKATVDFSKNDYRAFCVLVHREHGALLLHCTRKKRKPPHYQLPGGHVDGVEFHQVCKSSSWLRPSTIVTQEELFLASRIGCAREVYEETSMDFRTQLDRFRPLVLYEPLKYQETQTKKDANRMLINEYKHRIFFVCEVSDEDFAPKLPTGSVRYTTLPKDYSCNLVLQLSVEHTGFILEKDPTKAVTQLNLHSGGKVEQALDMALRVSHQQK